MTGGGFLRIVQLAVGGWADVMNFVYEMLFTLQSDAEGVTRVTDYLWNSCGVLLGQQIIRTNCVAMSTPETVFKCQITS